MNRIFRLTLLAYVLMAAALYPAYASAAKHPIIMVSIKPFYNLCAKVMQSVGKPVLLLQQNASPHDYQLKPSNIKLIDSADLVIWGGPELESYLQKPIANTTSNKDLNLAAIKNLKLFPIRSSTNWEEDDHHHAHNHDHDHEHSHSDNSNDPHFWLNPDNAVLMAKEIANHLSKLDPANSKTYHANAADFAQQIQNKKSIWHKELAHMQHKPFIVFHDAYQYFDQYFGLAGVGSISLNPEIPPSIKRVQQIQQLLNQQHVQCIFSEPQFNNKIIQSLTKDINIYHGELDPLGQDNNIGPNGYIILIDNLVTSFKACKK